MFKAAKSFSGALLAIAYGCGTVCEATISGSSGAVLINEGSGFVPLTGAAELAPGARVMVNPGQVATITYSDSCSVKVGSDRVWTIQSAAPCAHGTREVDFTGRMNDGMASPRYSGGEYSGFDPGAGLVIGAAVVGGGLGIACSIDWCRSHKKKASP
jgi:hypothetical protein